MSRGLAKQAHCRPDRKRIVGRGGDCTPLRHDRVQGADSTTACTPCMSHGRPQMTAHRAAAPAPQPRRRDAAPVAGEALRAGAHVGAPRARREARGLGEPGPDATPPRVVETFQYAMFCLLVLMCFGERLDEPAHLFRARLDKALALRRRVKELLLPLINARREYKKREASRKGKPRSSTRTWTPCSTSSLKRTANARSQMMRLSAYAASSSTPARTPRRQGSSTWVMAELVKNPAIQEKLYNEVKAATDDDKEEVSEEDVHKMPYLKAVILEALRKHPPGHFVLLHKAAEDMDIGGYLIPQGTTVNFMVAEMGRDEQEWKNPMQFSPERFLPGGDGEGVDVTGTKAIRMMPFSVGRRICAGLGIAMLHLEYFVANMVLEYEWKEVPGDEVDFAEKNEFTVVMKKPLRPLLVLRRSHLN
ncbi:unnamed protein product [Miscanthus lutarioriparius]|uniref:Cytochrome P450 n=1 Tax=Miscanthus lutarioriparius TaxID=422564 RepID=A0A811MVJ5_9POAL|nr:unnamed protein product [Miscanthus lutarioriparius]